MQACSFLCASSESPEALTEIFRDAFTHTEGEQEGAVVSELARNMLQMTAPKELRVFVARTNNQLVGCIFFSRLLYPNDARTIWLLSPVAVVSGFQKQGIGSGLIQHGLQQLKEEGSDAVFTYGDPNFYERIGFVCVSETFAQAPFKLSMPQGWLAIPLSSTQLSPMRGSSKCVEAISQAQYW